MPYVHLANGDIVRLTAKEFGKVDAKQETFPRSYRKDGKEHVVTGVFPDEVEYELTEEEQEEKDKTDAANAAKSAPTPKEESVK